VQVRALPGISGAIAAKTLTNKNLPQISAAGFVRQCWRVGAASRQ
jgi:hypothetical protein